jgi:phosphatidylserine decarboxylase
MEERQFDEYVVRDAWKFVLVPGIAALLALLLGWRLIFWLLLVLTLFVIYFFRNPRRHVTQKEGLVVAPADGKVLSISEVEEPKYFEGPAIKISIFMSVMDVHVNRMPDDVEVEKKTYYPGEFLVASYESASEKNERCELFLRRPDGQKMILVQVAGLIARRIICHAREGNSFSRGEIFGLIRFGSRLDIFLPKDTLMMVSPNQRTIAGETVLGYLPPERDHAHK